MPTRPRRAGLKDLSEAARTALAPVLDPSEGVERVVAAVGCTLVLTDRQLVLVRDGASHRPRSGVLSWPLDRKLTLHLAPGRRDMGRLVIERAGHAASAFLTTAHMNDADALIAETRHRIYADG
jgi:hypothetical protein